MIPIRKNGSKIPSKRWLKLFSWINIESLCWNIKNNPKIGIKSMPHDKISSEWSARNN
jgi:hypothetical protein